MLEDSELRCNVEHVDGAMNAQRRALALEWLKERREQRLLQRCVERSVPDRRR